MMILERCKLIQLKNVPKTPFSCLRIIIKYGLLLACQKTQTQPKHKICPESLFWDVKNYVIDVSAITLSLIHI